MKHTRAVTIFADSLLRASVVIDLDGELFIVPNCEGGWLQRQRLNLTPEARTERLQPARGVSPA